MNRIRVFAGAATALLAAFLSLPPAFGDDYPSKPIKFVVPAAPAGIGDILPRLFAQKLAESGNPATIVVENRAGGAGVIGADGVAKSPADGYTLLMGNHAVLAMYPHMAKNLPYDPLKSFAPVILQVTVPNILVVHPSIPANSLAELIAHAKANPGNLSYASQGTGASGHIAAELLKLHAGIDIVHVPYKGAAPAAQDLAAGHVSMMFDVVSLALPQIKAGRVRALGVAAMNLPARRRRPSHGSTAKPPRCSRRPTPATASYSRAPRCRSARRKPSASSSRLNPPAMATSSNAPGSSWNSPA